MVAVVSNDVLLGKPQISFNKRAMMGDRCRSGGGGGGVGVGLGP